MSRNRNISEFQKENIPMYYINLDRRSSRKEEFEKQIDIQDIKVERFAAYDGTDDKESRNENIMRGQFGCWMSHSELWKKVVTTNKTSIIFEDDIEFCDNFKNKLNEVFNEGKYLEYDILLLGHNWYTNKTKVTKNICTIELFYGLHSYVITPKSARYLIKKYSNIEEVKKPLDVELGEINRDKEIKIVAVYDKLITLNDFSCGSDTNRR